MIKINKIIINFLATFLLYPVLVLADNITIKIPNPAGSNNNLLAILKALLSNVVMPIGAVVVVMYIIYAGFTFVTAQGKPKEIEDAKKRLLWALVGAAVLLGAVAISAALCTTLKAVLNNTSICA
jgi:hypothetical protein